MSEVLDAIMEEASQALGRLRYLRCEELCLQALHQSRRNHDWAYYGRILLPLQEARRQRRIIAAEGRVRLGSTQLEPNPDALLAKLDCGSLVLTHPHRGEHALALSQAALHRQRYVEVLFADNPAAQDTWTVRSFTGPAVSVSLPAPPPAWRDRWWTVGNPAPAVSETNPGSAPTPGDWVIDASEALGDAALAQVDRRLPLAQQLEQLERCLLVVTDHELIHQALEDVAKQLRLEQAA